MNKNTYTTTCLITGKTDNLRMHAIRNGNGLITGWVFLHQSVESEQFEGSIKWDFKVKVN